MFQLQSSSTVIIHHFHEYKWKIQMTLQNIVFHSNLLNCMDPKTKAPMLPQHVFRQAILFFNFFEGEEVSLHGFMKT